MTHSHHTSPVWGHLLNAAINVFWTCVCVLPVNVFCWKHTSGKLFSALLAISFVPYLLPRRVLPRMGASETATLYRRLRVDFVNLLSQDGKLVRRILPSAHAGVPDAAALRRLYAQTFVREQFHLACFVFFAGCLMLSLWKHLLAWSAILLAANIVYNVYPILMQHSVRLRLERVQTRRSDR